MSKKIQITWSTSPAAHDYPSAPAYLLLLCAERTACRHVRRLRAR